MILKSALLVSSPEEHNRKEETDIAPMCSTPALIPKGSARQTNPPIVLARPMKILLPFLSPDRGFTHRNLRL